MKTFFGGIHPKSNKAASHLPITTLLPPEELTIPVTQHIGAPAVPSVKPGDTVLMGQKIADAQGFVSANIHSPVSGIVKSIEKRLHPNGLPTECIIITNDFKNAPAPELMEPKRDYKSLCPDEIISCIRDAGIVGVGGATFPTHVKLSPPQDAKIDYIILNGAECEPYLTSDHRTMLENSREIITGLAIIMKIFNLKEGYIGIENNKHDAIEKLKSEAEQFTDGKIHIVSLKTKYPQGSEKQLIYAVTKRKIKSGQLPWQIGCIVSNVETARLIKRAVVNRIPLIKRIVTVGGDAVKKPGNFYVPIGTSFAHILENAGGFSKYVNKVIMGGPMMGMAVPNTSVPVIKGTSGILAFGEELAKLDEAGPCLNCGKCVFACPMNLQPNLLDKMSKLNDFDSLEKLHIFDCLECGSCAYVCPSKRRQVQEIKIAKVKIKNINKKAE